jgi:hypothetical protein
MSGNDGNDGDATKGSGTNGPGAALASTAVALIVGVGAWYLFGKAADSGVQRLERLDVMRAYCMPFYAQARSMNDTIRVDRAPLPDTIDAGSKDAFDRCGDFRGPSVPNQLPNAREMNGEEMPRGLR